MYKMNRATISLALLALVTIIALAPAGAFAQVGNIDTLEKNAWAENAGWLDFRPSFGGVTVGGTYLSGYAWSENAGWVKLGSNAGGPYLNTTSTNWGVNHSLVTGDLTGFGWSENAGWINFSTTFSTVSLNNVTLKMTGYAWSENAGWIHFRNGGAFPFGVATTSLPVELQRFAAE